MTDRPFPHDLGAERALLGALLTDGRVVDEVATIVRPEDMYRPDHGELLALVLDLAARRVPIDFVTVNSEVLRRGPGRFGGAGYVAELPEHCPATVNAGHYAAVVRDLAIRRRGLEATAAIARALHGEPVADLDGDPAADAVLRWGAAHLAGGVRPDRGADRTWTLADALGATEDERERARETATPPGMPTGFDTVDELLRGGLRRGQLVVIGGAASMGKSALALSVAVNLAQRGAAGLYVSLEPQRSEWSDRAAAALSGIPLERIEDDRLRSQGEWDAILALRYDVAPKLALDFVFRARPSFDEVASLARQRRARGPLDFVVVDYLTLMRFGDGRRDLEIGEATAGLKALATDLGCVVVLLSQLSRGGQREGGPRGHADTGAWFDRVRLPELHDLRDSGSIEQDADVVLFPVRAAIAAHGRRPVEGTSPSEAVVVVAKNRNGPTGKAPVAWDAATVTYQPDRVDPSGPV